MHTKRKQSPTTASKSKQKGVAIITALLIVTIAATISITISTRLQLDVRRTSNMIAQDQALFYLLAAEEWSQRILREDRLDNNSDSLDEEWATEIPPLPVGGGSIQGKLIDLHSCININSLVIDDAFNTSTRTRLIQLFRNLGINEDLTPEIKDWIDSDLENTSPGAEDGYYLNLEKPYRTANTSLQSISELRLIKGFEDSEIFNALKPHVCAYPAGDIPLATNNNTASADAATDKDSDTDPETEENVTNSSDQGVAGGISINVNTASAEVLKSLSAQMTDNLAQDIISCRENEAFRNITDFTSCAKLDTIIKDKSGLTTSSKFFLLETRALIGQANRVMYSIIYRDTSGKTQIISRSQRTL